MLVQNYGWPTGPTKIWLWLARRPFGWPRTTGPAGSTTPEYTMCSNDHVITLFVYDNDKIDNVDDNDSNSLLYIVA